MPDSEGSYASFCSASSQDSLTGSPIFRQRATSIDGAMRPQARPLGAQHSLGELLNQEDLELQQPLGYSGWGGVSLAAENVSQIVRQDKPQTDAEKVVYVQAKQANRANVQTAAGYASLKKQVALLRQHFPRFNKFSRQDSHLIALAGGAQQTVILPASVVLDQTKPDGFFVLGNKLGSGAYGSAKDSWYQNAQSALCDADVEKVMRYEGFSDLERAEEEQKIIQRVDGNSELIERHDGKKLYLSMKKRKGKEFFQHWCDGSFEHLNFFEILSIMQAVHAALQKFHGENLVHYDVKPENIMLFKKDGKWQAGLVDFGFSVDINSKAKFSGTPHYMHPYLLDPYSHLAGQWVDAHGEAALFALLLCGDEKYLISKLAAEKQEKQDVAAARGQQTRVALSLINTPYDFNQSDFVGVVPEQYRKFLALLLEHLEGRKFSTPTDKQISACLQLLELHDSYVSRNKGVTRDTIENIIQQSDSMSAVPELRVEFNRLAFELQGFVFKDSIVAESEPLREATAQKGVNAEHAEKRPMTLAGLFALVEDSGSEAEGEDNGAVSSSGGTSPKIVPVSPHMVAAQTQATTAGSPAHLVLDTPAVMFRPSFVKRNLFKGPVSQPRLAPVPE